MQSGFMSEVERICIAESIKNTSLTRQDKINRKLNNLKLDFKPFDKLDTDKPIDVVAKGRNAILNYLNSLDSNYITQEMILFLDSCRMVLKDSDKINHQQLSNVLNYTIKGKLYVKKNW